MKKLFLFIPLFLLFTTCIAQKFDRPEVKAKNIIFKCEKLDDPSFKSIRVYNKNNSLEETQKNHFGELLNIRQLLTRAKLISALWDAFGEEKLKALLPEKNMNIIYYINKNGKIKELAYGINKNSLITPYELEKLENNIINNVSFELHPDDIVKGDYFFIVMNTSFQKILDKK